MKILLVYPKFPDTYWSFSHALGLWNKRSAFPPLGLLTVAAYLPPTWQRRLVDLNVKELSKADIAWADVVFLSAMIVQQASLQEIITRCKALGKRVVVGGPFASTGSERLPDADHVFKGEAETTLPDFIRDLESGVPKRIYEAAEKPALTSTPVPQFDLVDLSQYLAMPVQFSRGCPFRCEFCDIIEIYGRVPRTKTNDQMLAELDVLYELGWRGLVFIVDDNFIGNKRNVKSFLPHLADWSERHGRPFSFLTEASLNLADDDELLGLMKNAGLRRVFIGIETPVERSLKEAQKGQNTRRDMLAAVHKIQGYGMEVMAGFIVGFDNDPDDIFQLQIDFIRASAIPQSMVGVLSALPDTQLWRRLEREGRLLADASGDNTDGSLNFVPRMDPAQLVEGYKHILKTIYSPREFYQRALDCLERTPQETPEPFGDGVIKNLIDLGRTLLTLGVRDRERSHFWRFVGRILRHHPHRLANALILASLGYHFRRITENVVQTPLEMQTPAETPMQTEKTRPFVPRIWDARHAA
ncbi:MAG: B12-binding domain-containing radical SAM protein [Planctomycetes bacterium]|nr:B12-binding domain-containing radical SAM protein [Planctomycetota bacterium]